MDKRSIFVVYNVMKKDIATTPSITRSRLNKALGLAQRKNYDRPYHTTLSSCTCPDAMQRSTIVCKHRLALMMNNPQETLKMRFIEEGPWDQIYKEVNDVR